jgi:Restriction endonuclease
MNLTVEDIDFSLINSTQFEELCYDLLMQKGFQRLKWRQGGADNGRDIEADLTLNNDLIGAYTEKWFFECKKFSQGVPPSELGSKIEWAHAEKVQHLVVFTTSYLTNSTQSFLEKRLQACYFRFSEIDGKKIRDMLLQRENHHLIEKYFPDQSLRLLRGEFQKWKLFGAILDVRTFNFLLNNTNFDKLDESEISFLWISYLHELQSSYLVDKDAAKKVLEEYVINKAKKYDSEILLISSGEWRVRSSSKTHTTYENGEEVMNIIRVTLTSVKDSVEHFYSCGLLKDGSCIEVLLSKFDPIESRISISDSTLIEKVSNFLD